MSTNNLLVEIQLTEGSNDPERVTSPNFQERKEKLASVKKLSGDDVKKVDPDTLSDEIASISIKSNEDKLLITEVTDEPNKEQRSVWDRFKGLAAIIVATAMVAVQSHILYYVMEVLKAPYSSSCYLFWAYLICSVQNALPLAISMYISCENLAEPFRDNRILAFVLLIRGVIGSSILFVNWHAIHFFGRPAPASVIIAMAPIFVYINAFFVLKEKLGFVPIINAIIAIGGVFIMNWDGLMNPGKTSEGNNNLLGSALALLSMYLLSWTTVLVRILRDVHPLLVNLSFGFCGAVLQGIVAVASTTFRTIDNRTILLFCFLTATISTVSNWFFNVALRYENAGIVSLLRTTEVLFSFLYQYLLFGIQPRGETAIGGALILFGVFCVTMRKIVEEAPENSVLRKYLFFLLY